MAEFLQIGTMAYNVDHIQLINMSGATVLVWFSDHPATEGPTEIEGEDAEAFRYWWENKATVYVASVAEPAAPIDPSWKSATLPKGLDKVQRHKDAEKNIV